jgi:signal peptidase I
MSSEEKTGKQTLKSRLQKPKKQWIKFGILAAIFIAFIVWHGNLKFVFLLLFIFDIYITQFIPWTWWKKAKNKTVYKIFSWVDAILFSLIGVYLINIYFFQNYQIPTSSLEKSLLVGDFLFVSKIGYGARVPNTPLSFPMVQNTLPVFNTKSFFEKPQWNYRRLKGLDTIDRNDIVVFNFPTGDTVAVKRTNPDYYVSCYREGAAYLRNNKPEIAPTPDLCYHYGREVIKNNPQEYGKLVYYPVDKRENYVKRCVGLPGDDLQIIENQVYINGQKQEDFEGIQHNYFVQTDGTRLSRDFLQSIDIRLEDIWELDYRYTALIEHLGLDAGLPVYHFPLTADMLEKIKTARGVKQVIIEPVLSSSVEDTFPLGFDKGWTRDNYGPLHIPKKGETITLTADNYMIYERAIRTYEKNRLEMRDSIIYINGQPSPDYTFKMDYYWMMGDNRHNSADSRSWGFVPEDHIVGRPVFVWISLDKDKSLFNGKIRWKRLFKNAKR